MNNKLRIKVWLLCAAAIVLFIGSCKKPTDGVSIAVSTSIIKYSALINFVDAKDGKTIPQNIKLKISGVDGGSVYNIAGQKDFTVSDGQIDVGLHPSLVPTTSRPVTFNLEISADNCLPVTQQVTVNAKQFFQTMTIKVLNLNSPPAGVNIATLQVDASSGMLTSQQAVKIGTGSTGSTDVEQKTENSTSKSTNAVYYDGALTSVVLPAGTSFYYNTYKDTVIGVKVNERVYGTPVTVASSSKANTASPLDGLTFSGVNITTSGTGSVDITYTPYTDTIINKQITVSQLVKNVYTGKVNVICMYSPGESHTTSLFPDNNFTSNTITLFNKQTSPESELLFNSAVKQKLDYLYFVGTVKGQVVTIAPDNTSSWRTSYVLDPNFINMNTGKKIIAGDSLESGINYANNKTKRIAVLKAPNGQLRGECRTQNVGNYYRAPYALSYSYSFNTNVDAVTIPDPENLSGYYFIDCGSAGGYYGGFIPNSGVQVQSGKICSATPISANAKYYTRYFDQTQTQSIGTGGSASVFTGWTGLKPLVSFDVSLICNVGSSSPNTIKPTYSNTIASPVNGPFVFKSIDGYWATRGLTAGQSLSYTVYLSKGMISFTKNSISEGLNTVTITYTGSSNSFCKIL